MSCLSSWHLIGLGLYVIGDSLFEFWLGKTEKFKASSKVELLLIGVGAVIGVDLILKLDRLFKKGN